MPGCQLSCARLNAPLQKLEDNIAQQMNSPGPLDDFTVLFIESYLILLASTERASAGDWRIAWVRVSR